MDKKSANTEDTALILGLGRFQMQLSLIAETTEPVL